MIGSLRRGSEASPRLGVRGEAFLVASGVAVFYFLARTSPYLAAGAFNDDGVYLALGKALAQGDGYRSIYAVGAPVHMKYPPALPALYAILWRLLPNLAAVHRTALVLSLVVTGVAAGVVWWLARARVGLGLGVALFFVVGPFLLEGSVQYFNLALTEPWFMLLWACALVLVHALTVREPGVRPEGRSTTGPPFVTALFLGAVVGAAVLFRAQAIVFIPAVGAALLLRRVSGRSLAAFLGGSIVPVAAWGLWHRAMVLRGPVGTQPDEGAYGSWWVDGGVGDLVRLGSDVVRSQLHSYATYMPSHLSAVWGVGLALWIALLVLAASGAARLWWRHPDLVLTTGATALVAFLWPWWQDRFVLTILPFVGILAGASVGRWLKDRPTGERRAAYGLLAVVAAVVAVRQYEIRWPAPDAAATEEREFHQGQALMGNSRYLLAASHWLLAHTPEDASVLAPNPVGIWLYTGRRVVNATPALPDVGPSAWDEPGRFLAERLAADHPTLVALGNLTDPVVRDVAAVQRACPEALEFLGFAVQYARVAFYRVHYEDTCLQESVIAPARARLDARRRR